MRVVLSLLSSVGGVVLLFLGGAATKWYFWDVVIRQAGEPDRSMLFWGLPILFIGMFALAAAGGLAFAVIHSFRSRS